MFFMLKSAPRILATGWDSASLQIHAITHGHSGDYVGMGLAGVQLLILALPTFGLIYMLIKMARRIATGLWRWSKGSVPKRISACGVMAAIVALLAWLWLPQVPLAPRGTSGPLYERSTWRPIGPQERGTVRDAAPAIVGWRVPGNTSPPPTGTLSGTPRPTSQPNAVPGSKKTPTPKATTKPQSTSRATSTPPATATPTAQAGQSLNAPTSTPLPAATSTPVPAVVDTPTAVPTQPVLPTETPLPTLPPTPVS
jgi:putative peptide zinc metalloprotease protein